MAARRRSLMRHRLTLVLAVAVAGVSALGAASSVGGTRSTSVRSGLIAFTRADGLYVMRSDGRGVRRIVGTGPAALYGGGAAWSPGGGRLVFATREGIWLMDANGQHSVRVATGGQPYWTGAKPNRRLFSPQATNFGSPTWSPDGRRVAFVGRLEPNDDSSSEIYVIDADGTGVTRLTHNRVGEGGPAWQPLE